MGEKNRPQRKADLDTLGATLKGQQEIDKLARMAAGKEAEDDWPPGTVTAQKIKIILDKEFPQ